MATKKKPASKAKSSKGKASSKSKKKLSREEGGDAGTKGTGSAG